MKRPEHEFADFHLELQEKQKRVLRIVLQSFDGKQRIAQTIGRLVIGDFVVKDLDRR